MKLTKTSSYRLKVKIATQISEFHKKGFMGFMAFKNVVHTYISDFPEALLRYYYEQRMPDPHIYEMIEDVMFNLKSE